MPTQNLEQTRFLSYQQTYIDKAPEEPDPVASPDGMTPTGKATKIMGARKNKYGRSGLSQDGRKAIQDTPRE